MDQKVIADHKEIANNFNVLFANIGAKLSAGNNQSNCAQSYYDYLNNPTPHRFTLSTINESYILSIVNKLKNKNLLLNDEISNKLLKAIVNKLSKPLTIIINQCLLTGIFPDLLKIAKVKPFFSVVTLPNQTITDRFHCYQLSLKYLKESFIHNCTHISMTTI